MSAADIDQAEQAAIRTEANAQRARFAAERLAEELAAARRGLYISEDRNDVPYSQQRADEYRLRKAEAEAQAKALTARLTQLDEQLGAEQARAKRLASTELRAPTPGVVWRPLVTAGSAVARDAEMLTLIDCSEIYATATFSGRRFDDLRPGGHAIVHVLGAETDYAGTVVDVRAMERSAAEERFAAPLPRLGERQILAIIRLDDPKGMASEKYCSVGRRIEVRFKDLGSSQAASGHVD
jgi:multidrug resistance efflux pump